MIARRHLPQATRLLPLVLLLVAWAARAAEPAALTRYVSPTGNDLAGANTCADPALPCATVAQALGQATAGDTVRLAAGVYRETGLTAGVPVTLLGAGAATTIVDGQSRGVVLTITATTPAAPTTLDGLTLRGGAGRLGGALAVEAGGQLVARRVTLEGNRADWGGALHVAGGSALIEDSRLVGNTAEGGGAVFVAAGTLAITRSEVSGNRAGLGGGLVVGPAAVATLTRSTFIGNEASQFGGGVYVQGQLAAANTLWHDNRAGGRGGGLFSDSGAALLEHTGWLGNSAALGGSVAGQGDIRLRNSYLVAGDGGECAATLSGSDNLLSDPACGLPVRPATGLLDDGRPIDSSNTIDAVPAGRCTTGASNATLTQDLRGQPRPTDADRDGSGECDIGPYEFQPRLVIVHAPSPADGALFAFGGDLGAFTLPATGRSWHAVEAAPGAYRFIEGRKTGWKLTGVTCTGDLDGGSLVDVKARSATVDLDAGETIICTFNTRVTRGSIGVALVADGPVVVPFVGDLGDFELSAPDHLDRRGGKLAPATYAIQAQPPAGWRVAAISCDGERDGGSTYDVALGLARVDLDNKETLSCVFRLSRQSPTGTLTIRHEATPADGAMFTYTGDLGPFALQAPSGVTRSFTLAPGAYAVHGLIHPVWTLSGLDCAGDLDGGTAAQLENATAVIDLDAGESITCTFRHVRAGQETGAITIAQTATPAEDVTFTYQGTLGEFSLALPDEATRAWGGLLPGVYVVEQRAKSGWPLDDITCDGDLDGGSVVSLSSRSATIDLDAGETIICSFANTRPPAGQGNITIVHEPTPADDTPFAYTGLFGGFSLRAPSQPQQSFSGLSAGKHTIGLQLPSEWVLSAIVCSGDTDGGSVINTAAAQVVIDLDNGESITCRFRPTRDDAPPPPAPYYNYLPFLRR